MWSNRGRSMTPSLLRVPQVAAGLTPLGPGQVVSLRRAAIGASPRARGGGHLRRLPSLPRARARWRAESLRPAVSGGQSPRPGPQQRGRAADQTRPGRDGEGGAMGRRATITSVLACASVLTMVVGTDPAAAATPRPPA